MLTTHNLLSMQIGKYVTDPYVLKTENWNNCIQVIFLNILV